MPFQAGQPSANPRGRPKKEPLLTRALLRWARQKGPDGVPNYDLLAAAIGARALAGDMTAAAHIFNRLEGLPVQHFEPLPAGMAAPIPFLVIPPLRDEGVA
jgi:hypothetical protein